MLVGAIAPSVVEGLLDLESNQDNDIQSVVSCL